MIDKQKLIDFLEDEIESCKIVSNANDKAIIWECKRMIKRINVGLFDVEAKKVVKNETSSQSCSLCKSNVNGKHCSSCGQKLSY